MMSRIKQKSGSIKRIEPDFCFSISFYYYEILFEDKFLSFLIFSSYLNALYIEIIASTINIPKITPHVSIHTSMAEGPLPGIKL